MKTFDQRLAINRLSRWETVGAFERCGVEDWLPTHDHVGFNRFTGLIQIIACLLHVKPDRVNFVASGFGKTISGDAAWISRRRQPQDAFGDNPTVSRSLGESDNVLAGIGITGNRGC